MGTSPRLAGFAVLAVLLADPAYGKSLKCRTQNVTVFAVSSRDASDSCLGAANAIRFLVSQGLGLPRNISIRVVAKMPDTVTGSAMGAYTRAKKEIFVLTYSALQKRSHLFKAPLNRSLYRSVVSHEVAHAIAAANFTREPSCLAHEYIAYVTLFSTMETAQRERILRQYPRDEDWRVQAPVLYFLSPLEYGAHAYRHFLKPENGKKFIRKVLNGEVLCDAE